MTKYRLEISTSVIIEADSPADAEREFTAHREVAETSSFGRIEDDLLLNAKIERLEIEEPWQE